jgi:hypothetical protein
MQWIPFRSFPLRRIEGRVPEGLEDVFGRLVLGVIAVEDL